MSSAEAPPDDFQTGRSVETPRRYSGLSRDREWGNGPDGVQSLVPAGWDGPRTRAIRITRQKDLSGGRVGSCVLIHPWSSQLDVRAAPNRYASPTADEPSAGGRWRFAGWRLGTVFHTKMVPSEQLAILTAVGASRRDGRLAFAVFVAWVGLALPLTGFETPIFVVGSLGFAGSALSLRSQRLHAVVALAGILAVLLGIGLAA